MQEIVQYGSRVDPRAIDGSRVIAIALQLT